MKRDSLLVAFLVVISVMLGLLAYSTVNRNNSTARVLKDGSAQFKQLMLDPSLRADGSSMIGTEFIDIELPEFGGGLQRLGSIRSALKVIIVFSSDDCELCFNERVLWSKLHELYPPDRLMVIGICTSKEKESAAEFIRKKNIKFPVYWDPLNKVRRAMGFRVSPLRVLTDKDNKIIDIERTQTTIEYQQNYIHIIDTLIEKGLNEK